MGLGDSYIVTIEKWKTGWKYIKLLKKKKRELKSFICKINSYGTFIYYCVFSIVVIINAF